MITDLPDGWDVFDPNANARTSDTVYETARAAAEARRRRYATTGDAQNGSQATPDDHDFTAAGYEDADAEVATIIAADTVDGVVVTEPDAEP